jgi:magnesium chelatase family protein
MSFASLYTRARVGVSAPLVTVEVHLSNGLPGFNMVGLPETAVKESKDRVRSAILNAGFDFPQQRITVNLAPADLPKEGGRYDLAIALGILAASAQVPLENLHQYEWLGELTLSGEIHSVQGIIPAVLAARDAGRAMVLPLANQHEAALCRTPCYSSKHLLELCAQLNLGQQLQAVCNPLTPTIPTVSHDLSEVRGQQQARRALEIAAAGGHNLLMNGPPGTGKTLLASCLPGILPSLNDSEALEVAAIYSVAQPGSPLPWSTRPFRAPHHTASGVALVGGV